VIIGTHALFGLGRRPLAPQVLLFVIAVVPAQHPRGPGGGRFGRRETGRSGQRGVGHRAAGSAGRLIIPLVLVGWDGKRAGAADRCGRPVEPLFAVICAWLVAVSTLLLPWGLAMAAGAMLTSKPRRAAAWCWGSA